MSSRVDVESLSSEQISQVLDKLTHMMLTPIVQYTDYGFELAASVLTLLQNNRRKVCQGNRHEISTKLFQALCMRDAKQLLDVLISIKLERNLILHYVDLVLSSSGQRGAHVEKNNSEGEPYVVPDFPPYITAELEPLQRYLHSLQKMYSEFRGLIVDRYEKVIQSQAYQVVEKKRRTGVTVRLNDALQNGRMAALKALDKFHSNQGVLTTYLITYVSHSFSSQYLVGIGESYTLTRNARMKVAKGLLNLNNRSVDIEESYEEADTAGNGEEALLENEYLDRCARFMSRTILARRLRFGMMICGVPYKLTASELAQLRSNSTQEP